MENKRKQQLRNNKELPVAKNEDVEFSMEAADGDDLEALERAEAAEKRQE